MRDNPPSKPSARYFAAKAVEQVLRDRHQLETALSRQPGYNRLSPRDRAFSRLIAATVFRRMGQIEAAMKPFVRRPPTPFVDAVLKCGVAQILFLKTPMHAAVGESVELLKSSPRTRAAAGMVNAVLRKVDGEGRKLAANVPPRKNLPGWIRSSWEAAYGRPALQRMAVQLSQDPPLDVTVRSDVKDWAHKMVGEVLSDQSVRSGTKGLISNMPGYEDGQWWVQDVAASLPVIGLGDINGLTALDMCAAPGGKTLQLAAGGAKVTALDKSEERLERVKENLERTKLYADLICADALEWSKDSHELFEIVLLDAPCTATGTFRRHPDVLYNRRQGDVSKLVYVQRKLLNAALTKLKPGGRLVYCTCSLQPEEGERQMDSFVSENDTVELFQPVGLPDWVEAQHMLQHGYLRTLPHLLGEKGGLDGFFSAILVKK